MVHDGTRVEVPTARQQEVPRQFRKLVRGAREQCTRAVHESGTSGAGWYTRVHEITQWCTSTSDAREVHKYEKCTRLVVHK